MSENEYCEIYVTSSQFPDLTKHSLVFDGKDVRILGMIPHNSRIIVDKKNRIALNKFLIKIERQENNE